jgi:hypothetical protein
VAQVSAADQKLLVSLRSCWTSAAREIQITFSSCGGSAAVTEPLSQEGSLETFLVEDEADIGGEATGGKLRHTILADFISDKCMSVLRVSASICISHVSLCVGSSTQHRLR